MFAPVVDRKEIPVSEQPPLFDPEPTWVDRLWQQIDPSDRLKVLAMLAKMATAALGGDRPPQTEERTDDA